MTAKAHASGQASDHIAALDGLRGTAVIMVLLFHFGWTFPETSVLALAVKRALWMGWVGVDLFFVLSGYLITRGLVAVSKRPTKERLRLFWIRRVLRIFPIYYIVLVVGALVALVVGAPVPAFTYWVYLQNYTLAFDPDFLRWTAHFWSLAIEEQFYFLWPLLALLAPRRALVTVTVALALMCIVLRAALLFGPHLVDAEIAVKLAYRATPTHMDGLLAGALLAILGSEPESAVSRAWRKVRGPLVLVAVVLLAGLVAWSRGFNNYDRRVIVLGYPLLAFTFAGMVSLAVDGALWPAASRFLTSAPVRACGRVSYGMYILHWPLVALTVPMLEDAHSKISSAQGLALGVAVVAVGIGLTYVAAAVVFAYIEMPFLRMKEKFHG